jgi:hypothetical protein
MFLEIIQYLKEKQGEVSDKDKTMDNVKKT